MTEQDAADRTSGKQMVADAYRQHGTGLVRFATVLVGPTHAQDVVSAAVLRVLERPPDSIGNPRAYLFGAVANQARNLKRAETRRRFREATTPNERGIAFQPEPYPEVRAAVERLSVRQRAVVYLAYWEDMTDHTIAEHLGIRSGSVRRHLARARRHLRRTLHEHDD